MLMRWDNAPHHREVSSFPYHVHKGSKVLESEEMNLDKVLEILKKEIGEW